MLIECRTLEIRRLGKEMKAQTRYLEIPFVLALDASGYTVSSTFCNEFYIIYTLVDYF